MAQEAQRTLQDSFSLEGIGLHEGKEALMTFHPAEPDTGFVFVRSDLSGAPRIPARPDNLVSRPRRTALKAGDAEIHTCEHALAALFGLGIDNALIELSGIEPPAGDGSAQVFADRIMAVGSCEQDRERHWFKIQESLKLADGEAWVTLEPESEEASHFEYSFDYDISILKPSKISLQWSPEAFLKEIAAARTFCLEREARLLQAAGLGKGANTQNTLVIGEDGVLENTLRWDDEFARHKLLDLIGDLALAGCRVQGAIKAHRSGHSLNQHLATKLFEMKAKVY